MTTLWATILVLGVLIFIHELGHYLAARSVGVRVDRFSVGFPPRFLTFTSADSGWIIRIYFLRRQAESWQWLPVWERFWSRPGRRGSGTEYCLAWIPLGGYVKMAGVIDESLDTDIRHAPDEFASKSPLAQAWVMSAGVIMNIFLAWFLFSGVTWKTGLPVVSSEPVVAQFVPDMPAERSGLEIQDRIVAVNGQPLDNWEDMSTLIHGMPDQDIRLTVQRDGQTLDFTVHSQQEVVYREGKQDTIGAIGIYPAVTYQPVGPIGALGAGFRSTMNGFALIGMSVKMLVTGEASLDELGGPIMIAQLAGESARAGWIPLLSFMALISVNLAFLNILPIPGLDGGHILVTLIQLVIRRELSIRVRLVIQQIGMALLLLLMITVVYNDLGRLFGH
ncbi:MAG: RIP metalloprotease RseP [Candidatus Neomarinimicrobiota bacterium]|nr:MAG: RIP metalloprotease RseP [Candidatus Neomarinimicrobiota bacterium]